MIISKLHKQLTELIEQGHSRKTVMINKKTFSHPLESDGCIILDVKTASIDIFNILTDDCGIIHNNGQEKFKTALILTGE